MKKYLILIICLMVIIPTFVYAEEEIVSLEKCVDGDTATFKDKAGNTFKTRFLAIDTPETVDPKKIVEKFGKEASTYTCDSLTNAKEIKLEYDDNSTKEDKYGRRLAWVFVDGELLQNNLINLGYAEVKYLYGDYKYTTTLQESESVAKSSKVGIWTDEAEEEEEEKVEEVKTTTEKKKGFFEGLFDKLVDDLLGKIVDYINDLLDSLVEKIESML